MSNPTLSDAIDAYLAAMKGRGQAHNTLRSKAATLRGLLAAVGNIRTRNLEPRHVDMFNAAKPNLSRNSRKTAISNIRYFQTWLHNSAMLPPTTNILKDYRNMRVPKVRRPSIPLEDIEDFLDTAPQPRDRILAALGTFTLCRVSELLPLQWKDIDFDNEEVRIWKPKVQEHDDIPMMSNLKEELLAWRRTICLYTQTTTPNPNWYVLCQLDSTPTQFGQTVGHRTAAYHPDRQLREGLRPIKNMLRRYGINEPGTGMHTLRRTGARALRQHLIEQGVPDATDIVSKLLGHKDLSMTMTYLDLDAMKARRDQVVKGMRMMSKSPQTAMVIDLKTARG